MKGLSFDEGLTCKKIEKGNSLWSRGDPVVSIFSLSYPRSVSFSLPFPVQKTQDTFYSPFN